MKYALLFWAVIMPLLSAIPSLPLLAQERDRFSAYEKKHYISAQGDTLSYRLLCPEAIKPETAYPLVIFMHGAGERGCDNQKQLTHGGQMWLNPVNREEHPAFVIFPQCPAKGYWAYHKRPSSFEPDSMPLLEKPTREILAVKELIEEYASRKEVDESRIYVIGLSMGGMATYDLAIRYPHLIAAAVPICGTVNPTRLKDAKGVKFRIYHGDNDDVVTPEGSRHAYKALKSAGADVTYIEYPGVNHGSWNPAFNDERLLKWMFSQHH